jgi:hypothetical protein
MTNSERLPSIDPGGYVLVMRCPTCKQPAEVFITVATRLIVDAAGAALRPAFHGTAVEHRCGQQSLIDAPAADPDVDHVGTVAMFSGRDRAAGEHLDR